ncbi:hypothetical protein EYC80_007435 [Monilinia laxa]|uniref:Uncharacterized protein n=1 Tax=Monilinia laxa TaxID=61186 RepID=A0A5N6JVG7_MONLA|nr:hypothetical protein EYC80_007435 [Monilinia laxa]
MSTSSNTPDPPVPEKKSRWPHLPGFYFNVEFKVSTSDNDKGHGASLKYASKNMKERERARANTHLGDTPAPISTPSPPPASQEPCYHQAPQSQLGRSKALRIKTDIPGRGRSAPVTVYDRGYSISPVSPLTPDISPIQQQASEIPEQTLTDHSERPLPSTPGRFRLGGDDLPWSTPFSYWNAEPDTSESVGPTRMSIEPYQSPPSTRRNEDSELAEDLSELQQAMMTVDSMDGDSWDPWKWSSAGNTSAAPKSIGWAVSSEDALQSLATPSTNNHPPPPYVVSQWEHSSRTMVAAERPRGTD